MAKISGVRVTVDTEEFKREMQEITRSTRRAVVDLARESLEAQVDAIRNADTQRRAELDDLNISVSKGTQNDPLQGAKVKFDEQGETLTVWVEHSNDSGVNIFNALDAGTPPRTAKKKAIFPMYEGNMTPETYQPEVADPKMVGQIITRNKVKLIRDPRGGPALTAVPAGRPVAGIAPRQFYRATAEWVERQLLDREIVTPKRRSRIRIKKGDVKISYTSEE